VNANGVTELIGRKQVVICAGSGGVGKTTTSAAIAAGMADRGLKTAVLTIDPARRLANSLGLTELGNEEARVDLPDSSGELWAMMLDAKRTFDELIDTYAPDEQTRESVLANPIYRQLSNAVAGSQEYMAMEKLHELHQEGRYDLLVLDTPPSRNALDFLEAPRRLSRFIDSRSLKFFQASGRMSLGIMGKGTGVLFSIMKRATGVDLLRDLSDFFNAFGSMTEGFSERARRVEALLGDSRTTFLLVTSPRESSIQEAEWFSKRLREEDLPFGGVIVNRVRPQIGTRPSPQLDSELTGLLGDKLGAKVARTLGEQVALAEVDAHNMSDLKRRLGRKPTLAVPELAGDVHDLAGLRALNEHLF
jgi:anion-transporting  ArsA/GET3 family ATPase